jgi:hypothetical protein
MTNENRIIKIEIELNCAEGSRIGYYVVAVTKEFEEQYGGGAQVFKEHGGRTTHSALDKAREMVTVSPGSRTDVEPWATAWKDRKGVL